MARVTEIFRPADYPGNPDDATRAGLDALWRHLFPATGGEGEPHAGYAILAHSPQTALQVARMTDFVIGELPWAQRRDLRELAVQALNWRFKCDFSWQAHLELAKLAGISLEQQQAIPDWRTSELFDDEQRLVIEYTLACVGGQVPEDLFARVVARYGEAGAVEFTVTVGWWSLWAMLLNAAQPEFRRDRARPLPKDGRERQRYERD